MPSEILDLFYAVATEIAGPDAVARIQDAKGGCEVNVPNRTAGGHWLCDLLGVDAGRAIMKRLRVVDADDRLIAGPTFYIPLGSTSTMEKKRAEIDDLLRSGLSVATVVRRTGITVRTVRRRLAVLKRGGVPGSSIGTVRS